MSFLFLILKTIYNRPYSNTNYLSSTTYRLKVYYFFKIQALCQKARSLVLSAHHLLFILILFLTCVLSIASYATANAASVTLTWDKNANASGYIMYYGTISKNYTYSVDVKNNTSCTISGLNEMEHFGLSSAMIKGIVKSYSGISDLK